MATHDAGEHRHGKVAFFVRSYAARLLRKAVSIRGLVGIALVAMVAAGMGGQDGASAPGAPRIDDRDGDGMADDVDRCVDRAGLRPDGCPPRDSDADGILDRYDGCPDAPGPARNQGCPDRDRDGDGVVDRRDQCVDVYGDLRFAGCVMPDKDGDGIADPYDRCADRAEVWNDTRDSDGCPDRGRAMVAPNGARTVAEVAYRTAVIKGRLVRGSGTLSRHGRRVATVSAALLAAAGARQVRVISVSAAGASEKDSQAAARHAETFAAELRARTPRLQISVGTAEAAPEQRGKRAYIELLFR